MSALVSLEDDPAGRDDFHFQNAVHHQAERARKHPVATSRRKARNPYSWTVNTFSFFQGEYAKRLGTRQPDGTHCGGHGILADSQSFKSPHIHPNRGGFSERVLFQRVTSTCGHQV